MWYKKRWLTEPDAEAMLEAKDKKIEELTEKLLSDDRQISAYDIEVNELRDKLQSDDRQISEYDHELRQAKGILKAAFEDIVWLNEHTVDSEGGCLIETATDTETCLACPLNVNNSHLCGWKHQVEALALIGGESDD